MHRNSTKLIPVALIAAIGLGLPALAKSIQKGKANTVARAERTHLLNGNGSARRAPAVGTSNPNSPAHTGSGASYNPNLYVY